MLNGDKVYRYDQNKTLTWLAKKVNLYIQDGTCIIIINDHADTTPRPDT
jgi:hypothetical protein